MPSSVHNSHLDFMTRLFQSIPKHRTTSRCTDPLGNRSTKPETGTHRKEA